MTKNVILLTIDTFRRDVIGAYGAKTGVTPFLDSIQDKCIRFTKCQSVAPYTQASFPGILTSSYLYDYAKTGSGPAADALSPRRRLISEAVSEAGLKAAAFHSNPYLCGFFGWERGWETFYDSMEADVTPHCPYVKGDAINAKADAWLAAHAKDDKPFFLWTHYMDIHEPYVPERRYVERVAPAIDMSADEMFNLFTTVVLRRNAKDRGVVGLLRKLYLAHIAEVDDYVRAFFAILEKHGVLANSVVIITSDHGEEFGEHGGLSHDGKMTPELLDVPLFIYDPDRASGEVCDKLVSGLDTSPTILHLLGIAPDTGFQGRSLLPVADYAEQGVYGESTDKRGKKQPTDKPVYFYREGDLRVVYSVAGEKWELYDLAADPGQTQDIFDASPDATRMKEKLAPRIGRAYLA